MKFIRDLILRRGLQTAAQLGADAAATATSKAFVQRFAVRLPVTVFVRGSHVDVRVQYQESRHTGQFVELNANLRAFFGWEFVADQDEAGVYIVAKRKPIVGALSSASFTLIVPPEANVVLHLTPGSARLTNFEGKLTLPAPALATSSAPVVGLLTAGKLEKADKEPANRR